MTGSAVVLYLSANPLTDILQHAQQGVRNRVSQAKIQGFTLLFSQEIRFLSWCKIQVEDVDAALIGCNAANTLPKT